MCDIYVRYQGPAQVRDRFERIAVEDRFGSMLRSACVSGFSVLFGDALVNKRFLNNVGDGFEVDGTVQVV